MILKLTISQKELLSILSLHFHTEIHEMEIRETHPLADKLRGVVERFKYMGNEKIAAIKELREATRETNEDGSVKFMMALADAKYAVENWESFIQFINRNGRLPLDNFSTHLR